MKLRYVDVLRALAVLGVLMVHCSIYGNKTYYSNLMTSIFTNGKMGVQLFYIGSAFTLFLSMGKRFDNEKYPNINFFIRRFFRIAPMFYIGICYYLWQNGYLERFLDIEYYITNENIWAHIFFFHGFNPYWINSLVPGGWSIAVEMLFYCFVPFLFTKIKNTQQAFVFVFISLILSFCCNFFLKMSHIIGTDMIDLYYLGYYFPSQLPVFALGILLYFIVKENYKISISPILIFLSSILLVAHLCGIHLPNQFLFGIAFVILAIAFSKNEYKILENFILVYIGKISYSMYLVHFAILHWLSKLNFVDYIDVSNTYSALLNFSIRFLLLTVLSVIVSSFFYWVVELPMQNVGKKLIYKLNK